MKKFLEILKKNKMKAFGVLAVIALAFSFFGGNNDDSTLEVSVQEVGTKNLSSKVVADGVLTPETESPLGIAYETPQTLGMDRLAAAIGSNEIFPNQRALIISLLCQILHERRQSITQLRKQSRVRVSLICMRIKTFNSNHINLRFKASFY